MYESAFEHCCGAAEIGELFGTYAQLKDSLTVMFDRLKENRAQGIQGNGDVCPGVLIATTISSQRPAIRALKFHKFRQVLTFTNPGTGNKVTLWTKKLVR